MRIAFVTFRLPHPPHRGDRLHVSEILKCLSTRHDVSLFALTSGNEPPEALDAVARICRTVSVRHGARGAWGRAVVGLATTIPSQVLYCRSRALREALAEDSGHRPFDVAISHSIRMAQHVTGMQGGRRILFLCDALGDLLAQRVAYAPRWMRPALHWERRRLDSYTARMRPLFHDAWVFSPLDRDYEHSHGCPSVRVVRHGVQDTGFGAPRLPSSEPVVMFLGNLSVAHNIDAACFAARSVLPLIQREEPSARLILAGADPTARVRALAHLPGVEVPGMLASLAPLWSRATVFLAPVRFSAGIQNKVLEAAAAGVPLVTTPRVAKAVGFEPGVHALVADNAPDLAKSVLATLRAPAEATERAARAREWVAQEFRWECALEALESIPAGSIVSSGKRSW